MRSTTTENVQEHSMQVAVLSHALAIIGRDIFKKDLNPDLIAAAALYHDCSEILTGDMPTPVKYQNDKLTNAYKTAEYSAKQKIFELLPEALRESYRPYVFFEEEQPEFYRYIKAADKLAAYIKCVHEVKTGNTEFLGAQTSLREILEALAAEMEELSYFIEFLLPSYSLSLDDLWSRP